jgi:hypothetical protein
MGIEDILSDPPGDMRREEKAQLWCGVVLCREWDRLEQILLKPAYGAFTFLASLQDGQGKIHPWGESKRLVEGDRAGVFAEYM